MNIRFISDNPKLNNWFKAKEIEDSVIFAKKLK